MMWLLLGLLMILSPTGCAAGPDAVHAGVPTSLVLLLLVCLIVAQRAASPAPLALA